MSALTFVCRSLKETEMKLVLILFLPSVAFAQGVPAPQDGVSFSIFFQFLLDVAKSPCQLPPGLGGVQQSVQALSWRNANCGGTYTGEVNTFHIWVAWIKLGFKPFLQCYLFMLSLISILFWVPRAWTPSVVEVWKDQKRDILYPGEPLTKASWLWNICLLVPQLHWGLERGSQVQ